ncbi:hypothetical protein GTY44_29845, partial [Streptomyces sp. SID5914]
HVRVRCGRRRVRVRARLSFGDRPATRAALRTTAGATLTTLGLARPLKPRVTLRATPHWRPPGTPPTAGRPHVATPPPADRSPSAEVPGSGGTAPDRTVPLGTEPAV